MTQKQDIMKKLTLTISLIALFQLICTDLYSQNHIKIDASFYSEVLDTVKKVDIYLPGDYYVNTEQQYATIYYLHGGNGDQNSGQTKAMWYYNIHSQDTTITSPAAIFVCPDGSCEPYVGSVWVNSVLYGNYEDYVMQDVVNFVESNFRAFPDKNFRMITGTSMGGFGSSWLSVNYPEKFRACFPYIGVFLSFPDTTLSAWRTMCYEQNGSYNLNYNAGFETQALITGCGGWSPNLNIEPYHVEIIFDTLGNWVDTVLSKWYQFDVSRKVKDLPTENELSWFLGCGTTDYMITYPAYQIFMDSLNHYGIGYDSYFFEGGHVFDVETWMAGMHWMDSIINYSFQTMGIEITRQPTDHLTVYPNPASSQINISYQLNDANKVKIEIFNQKGQQLEQVLSRKQQKGKHHMEWNISNYPPGIYFCQLQIGNEMITKKIIKTK